MKTFYSITAILAMAVAPFAANAQDLLAGKPVHTLGDAKTWTAGEQSYTFVTADLAKLVAEPRNTTNVYLYPENGTLNTAENQEIGMQGFYVDMEISQEVGTVSTTWEGAAADSYDIYLTDEVPTLSILGTTPTYTATGLGQYTSNVAIMPEGAKGRYLVFQGTKATNWGWGVKIRSISAAAPQTTELTTFAVSPTIVEAGVASPVSLTFKDQLGLNIDPADVSVTVSGGTYEEGKITVPSGTAVFTATMGDVELTANIYAATAPSVPVAEDIKTPIFTNGVTDKNASAGWYLAYNGGAVDNGTLTFADGEVARSFANARCIFIYNSETTGAWNANINPKELGYGSLELDVFSGSNCSGMIEFEGTDGVIPATNNFTLEAGKWNHISVNVNNETRLNNMSIRFNEANMCDILLSNIYFTPAFEDTKEPELGEITYTSAAFGLTLNLTATDDHATDIKYTVTLDGQTYEVTGKNGETATLALEGLDLETEYTLSVVASDGTNTSEAQEVKAATTKLPAYENPQDPAANVGTLFCSYYKPDYQLDVTNWSGNATDEVVTTEDASQKAILFSYMDGALNSGFAGLNFDLGNAYKLYVDIYPAKSGNINLGLQVGGANQFKTVAMTANQWNNIEIALADFNVPANGTAINQVIFTGSNHNKFAMANLYVLSADTFTGIDNVTVGAGAAVSVYNMQGRLIRANVSAAEATAGLPAGLYIVGARKVLVK